MADSQASNQASGSFAQVSNEFLAALMSVQFTARELRVMLYCVRQGGYDNDKLRLCQATSLFPHNAKSTIDRLVKGRVLVANGNRYDLNTDPSTWALDVVKASRSA
jgi:hypothetical protein